MTLTPIETRADQIAQHRASRRELLDQVVRARISNFADFQAMLDAPGGYFPTLRADLDGGAVMLADAYDAAQAERGDPRRAYRNTLAAVIRYNAEWSEWIVTARCNTTGKRLGTYHTDAHDDALGTARAMVGSTGKIVDKTPTRVRRGACADRVVWADEADRAHGAAVLTSLRQARAAGDVEQLRRVRELVAFHGIEGGAL